MSSAVKAIKVGLLGYGRAAPIFHTPFITREPAFRIVAILQRAAAPPADQPLPPKGRAGHGEHCTVDFPEAKHYRVVDEFLADQEVELVVINTRADTHCEFAEKALLAGKDVVVEKPLGINTEWCERAIAARDRSGKKLIMYHNRRYDADSRTLLSLVQREVFGDISEAEFHFDLDMPDWMSKSTGPGWKPGEGMNFGIGCHMLDQVLVIFGRPKTVTAFYRTLRRVVSESEDSFTMILGYEPASPLIVSVKCNVRSTMRLPLKNFVRGSEGTWVKFGNDVQEDQIFEGLTSNDEAFGVQEEDAWGYLTTRTQVDVAQVQRGKYWEGRIRGLDGSYQEYYRDVARAIRGEIDVVCKPETARDGIRIIELARESAKKGVTLPFDLS